MSTRRSTQKSTYKKSTYKNSERRADLQGVRALAVILVALNHANIPALSGGYIGVDVFFVLSGFFITRLLLDEAFGNLLSGAHGARISIVAFYERRARRILPAACLTLVVSSLAVYLVYHVSHSNYYDTKSTLLDALAASLFYANIHFEAAATNYFVQAGGGLPSPFQHFWSLSVEEQFYVVWPSLLIATFFVARALTRRRERRSGRRRGHDTVYEQRLATWLVSLVMAAFCIASFVFSVVFTHENPNGAYFNTFTRVWELGLGAVVAMLVPAVAAMSPHRLLRALAGAVGLAMILYASFSFSGSTLFPGYAALMPTVGCALIVLAGVGVRPLGVGKLLASRPMGYIGDRSYTLYLWHYPVLIIVWTAAGHELSTGMNLLLLLGAFALSCVTYGLYENPLRYARWLRGWRTLVMAPAAMGAALATILVPVAVITAADAASLKASHQLAGNQLQAPVALRDPSNLLPSAGIPAVTASTKASLAGAPIPKTLTPTLGELSNLATDTSSVPQPCYPTFGPGITSKICWMGDTQSKQAFVIFGDSHSGPWIGAAEVAAERLHMKFTVIGKPGCFISKIGKDTSGWPCKSWYEWALKQDHAIDPVATLVDFAMFPYGTAKKAGHAVALVRSVLHDVAHPVLIEDPPAWKIHSLACLSKTGATQGTCLQHVSIGRKLLIEDIERMRARTDVPVIATLQWYCSDYDCPMVVGHTIVLRDESHMSTQYSQDLGGLFTDELSPIVTKLETQRSG